MGHQNRVPGWPLVEGENDPLGRRHGERKQADREGEDRRERYPAGSRAAFEDQGVGRLADQLVAVGVQPRRHLVERECLDCRGAPWQFNPVAEGRDAGWADPGALTTMALRRFATGGEIPQQFLKVAKGLGSVGALEALLEFLEGQSAGDAVRP